MDDVITNLPEDTFSCDAQAQSEEGCSEGETEACGESIDTVFSRHMSEYIGKTVTIYTSSGGPAGCGMTGILLNCTASHVRLVTQAGPAPEKPVRKACRHCPYYKSYIESVERAKGLGAVAEIPLPSIVMFVHNSL